MDRRRLSLVVHVGNRQQERFAHLLTMVGEAAWIGKCILGSPQQWDLAIICGAFFILGLRCWLKWAPTPETN